jgi:nitrogen fixation protein FixH
MVIVATHDRSFAVEPDYYQKGLHFEQTIEQRRENARLGWAIKLELGPSLSGSNVRGVTCMLRDRDGASLADAKIDLVAFAHLRASRTVSRVLLPEGEGRYVATVPFGDPGIWEFRLVVTRGKDTFTQVIKESIVNSAAAAD